MSKKNLPALTNNLPSKVIGKKVGNIPISPEMILRGVEVAGDVTRSISGVQVAKQAVEKARVDSKARIDEKEKENENLRINRAAETRKQELKLDRARMQIQEEMKKDETRHIEKMTSLNMEELKIKNEFELRLKEFEKKSDPKEILAFLRDEQLYLRNLLISLPEDASDERRQSIMSQIEDVRNKVLALHK